jgi:UDP-N-acetylmuramate dehydrogenase
MLIQRNVSLQPLNSFGIMARAAHLLAVRGEADVRALLADAKLAAQPRFVLGGGSNIVLTGDVKGVVLKVEVPGRRVVAQPTATPSWKRARARTGTTSSPGRSTRACPAWRTWP